MAANTKSIIFKITEAGKQSALQASGDDTKILIDLTHVAVGKRKYAPTGGETSLKNEVSRSDIVSGEVVGNTLRFTSTMYADDITPVYEMGIFTKTGVLFAVAASDTDPLVTLYPNIAFVASFGIAIDDIDANSVTVSIDSNNSLATTLMQNHVAASNPHPQYVALSRFQLLLEVMFPVGYLHYTNSATNPKAKFDELLGISTSWRRLAGKIIVGTDPSDNYIKDVGLVLGQKGMTELAGSNERPNVYPLYTKHVFERYNPDDVIETVWNISANKTSITEGGAVRFTVTANNIPDGQILSWTVKEGRLNSGSNDITSPDKSQNGTVIVKNGSASIDFTTSPDDNAEEPQKHVRLTVGAPASLSINVPINDLGNNETALHITQSTTNGMQLDEYYKQQSGSYPTSTDKIRFIVDAGVDIIAPNTSTPALIDGDKWPSGSQIVVENHGRILGRGGNGGRSARTFVVYAYHNKSKADLAKAGGNGGVAIKSTARTIEVENYSLIAGGGGGGGGMGAWSHDLKENNNFSNQTLGGGGGSGGGAPYGLNSPNSSSMAAYLSDDRFPVKLNYIGDPHAILVTSTSVSTVGGTGSQVDSTATKSADADKDYMFYLPVASSGGKHKITVNNGSGQSRSLSCDLVMSTPATLSAGIGGSNGVSGTKNGDNEGARYITKVSYSEISGNKGGDGGEIGENGKAGTIQKYFNVHGNVIDENHPDMLQVLASAAGGLAGYVKEGGVTITNYSAGTTKGR